MLSRLAVRVARSRATGVSRHFTSDNKPPKGFEKFFKRGKDEKPKRKQEEKPSKSSDHDPEDGFKGFKMDFDFNFNPKDPNLWRLALVGGGIAVATMYSLASSKENIPTITHQELISRYIEGELAKSLVIEISKTGQDALSDVYALDANHNKIAKVRVPDIANFLKLIEVEQIQMGRERHRLIPVEYQEKTSKGTAEYLEIVSKVSFQAINLLMLGSIIFMIIRFSGKSKGGQQGGSGGGFGDIFNMSRPNFKMYGGDKKLNVSFKDVAGLNEAKKEVMEFVEFLKNPDKFKKLGARIPRGALLVGPPGTGKTLLAKATAGEAGVPFFSISGSDFVEMFVGVGASRVRGLFKQAREKAPSIIFIDEIDAVGRKRFGRVGGNDERDNTLNQLLVEMDGFSTDTHVVVLAGTNRKDILDNALLRPGRFDRTIELTLPDLEGREEILKVHLGPIRLNPELSISDYAKRLAALSPGFSGADLENLCNEAAIMAARHNKEYVDRHDFESASERVIGGLEKGKKLNDKERSVVAHHEAGHAVVGWFLEGTDPILKVSILPRSKGALGFAQFLPNETHLYSKDDLLDKICAILGGRVAEEVCFGRITTGASDDLQKATSIAQALVASFGMNERLGTIGYNYDAEAFNKPFSEDTNRIIDEEVRRIVGECLERTRELILSKKEEVVRLAATLLEKERVTHRDLVEILGERPFKADPSYRKYVEEQSQLQEEPEPTEELKPQVQTEATSVNIKNRKI